MQPNFKAHLNYRKCGCEQELLSVLRTVLVCTTILQSPASVPIKPVFSYFFKLESVNSSWQRSLNKELRHARSEKATFPEAMLMTFAPPGWVTTLLGDLWYKQTKSQTWTFSCVYITGFPEFALESTGLAEAPPPEAGSGLSLRTHQPRSANQR